MAQQSLTKETITGTVDHIRFQAESGYAIAGLGDGTTIVGTMPGLRVGADVEVGGEWTTHKKYGRQFEVASFTQHTPTDVDGLAGWLGRLGGVGATYARRLAEAAADTDEEITADHFTDIDGVPQKVAECAAEAWEADCARRDALVALQGLGLTSKQADRAYKRWDSSAPGKVEANPYCLTELDQIGFATADGIARGPQIGIEYDPKLRLRAGAAYTLKEARQGGGHVGLPRDELCAEAADTLGVPGHKMSAPIDWMIEDGRLVERGGLIYRARDAADEAQLAADLRQVDRQGQAPAPDADPPDTLSGQQADAFEQIMYKGGVVTLTGGPGTGKTYTLKSIVDAATEAAVELHLASPTGRAAKRMEEMTGKGAKTIHRLLGYTPDVGRFVREPDSLEGLVIIDEASMLDTRLAAALTKRVHPTATLLFVGDPDQLPSVGPGYVLHDLMKSEVGTHCPLTEIHRQAEGSGIVRVAYQVNAGDTPDLGCQQQDFHCIEAKSGRDALAAAKACAGRLQELGYSLTDDVQYLAPMYDGEAGVNALNEMLQHIVHDGTPQGRDCGGTRYGVGDRVMQTRNNYDLGVVNGDVGTVADVAPNGEYLDAEDEADIAVAVDYPGTGRVNYTAYEAASEMTLAYACTAHKTQGAEYPVVVIVLTFHYFLNERTLLYTAITRAEERAILIAEPRALERAVDNNSPVDRHRNLTDTLNGDL